MAKLNLIKLPVRSGCLATWPKDCRYSQVKSLMSLFAPDSSPTKREHGFSLVEVLIAIIILSGVVILAVSISSFVVNGLTRAKNRSIVDSAMNAEASLLRERISEFHYCDGEFLIAPSDCNSAALGESERYFPSTETDQEAFAASCEGEPSSMKVNLELLLQAIPVTPGIVRKSIDINNSTMLVTVVLEDPKGQNPARAVSFYPPVAAFCP